MPLIGRRAFMVGTAAAAFAPAPALAQDYPIRPVTLIIPFPPGGSTTIVIRSVSDKLGEALGQQIVIDNRAGAGGTVGTRALARSEPDGYTIGLGSFPPKTLQELIAYAKANPGKVSFGSAGIGTVSHVCGEYFATATGIKLVHVPYKGTGPALQDLIGGHIPVAFAPIPATYANAKSGTMRMLAVTSLTRSTLAPEVPTIAEQGVPDFEAVLRYALVAPAGTPRPIIDKLNRALNTALAGDEVRKRLALEGAEPVSGTPEQYAADLDKEVTLWAKVVKESGAKAN